MRRALLVGGLAMLLCAVGVWVGRTATLRPFVLPDASEVELAWRAGGLTITYVAPGAPFAWRGQLAQQLRAAGWNGRSYSNIGARHPPFITVWFTRDRRVGPLVLTERAVFGNLPNDPTRALVEVYREVRWQP